MKKFFQVFLKMSKCSQGTQPKIKNVNERTESTTKILIPDVHFVLKRNSYYVKFKY